VSGDFKRPASRSGDHLGESGRDIDWQVLFPQPHRPSWLRSIRPAVQHVRQRLQFNASVRRDLADRDSEFGSVSRLMAREQVYIEMLC
jgi:hypothetical protein